MKTRRRKLADPETFIPQCDTIVLHRLAALLSVSTRHIRRMIENGCLKVPEEELARVRSREKFWTMVSIPREAAIQFLQGAIRRSPKTRRKPSRRRS